MKKKTPRWKRKLRLKLALPKEDRAPCCEVICQNKIQKRIRRISDEYNFYPYDDIEFERIISDTISNRVEKVKVKGKYFALKIFKLFDTRYSTTRYQSVLREVRALHTYTSSSASPPHDHHSDQDDLDLDPSKFHNYIIKLFDVYKKGGTMQLLLEYMNKGSLREALKRKMTMREEIVSIISYNILKALSYLKRRNIIHRDVKPANIFLSSDGSVKIGDFDLCKRQHHHHHQSPSNNNCPSSGQSGDDRVSYSATKGTFLFMSPQQIMGESFDEKTDVFSLGMTMLECILGKFPYDIEDSSNSAGGAFDPWAYLDFLANELPRMKFVEGDSMKKKEESNSGMAVVTLSEEFKAFFRSCTVYDQSRRSSADELLRSEFIKKYNHKVGFGDEERKRIIREWLGEKVESYE